MDNIDKNECLINGIQYKCRTCFDPGRTIYQLTEEASSNKTWLDLLKDVAKLQPNDDEHLPKTLCCKCSEKLKKSYDFVQQIQDVNEKYTELLAKNDALNNVDNIADCLAESAIALPLEQYMPEVKLEDEMVMSYDITNKLADDSEERFENEDNDDPFDDENAAEPLEESESAIETAGKNTAKRKLRKRKGSSEKSKKRARKSEKVKNIKVEKVEKDEEIEDKDKIQKIEDIGASGPIVCSKCPKTFFAFYAHLKHQKEDHASEGFDDEQGQCPLCAKTFKNKLYVTDHIKKVHDKIKPFKCSLCEKTFATAAGQRGHEITHTDEYPHKCEFCGRRFRMKGKLVNHLHIHTSKPELLCPICKRGQKSKEELEAHIKKHEDNRLQCPACGKLFTRRSSLNDHYNAVHLKLKLYKCQFCGQCFGDPKSKRTHEKRHHQTSAS